MKNIILTLCVLFINNLYAYEYSVSALRGEAKIEATGKALKANDELHFNDVIITSDKSFIKITDANGGVITLGAKSTIKLVKNETTKASTVELLKGQMRATFDKKESNDYKVFVKSKSAAMGIRGTDFHFIYNAENNVSTVLTYEGKVEFADFSDNKKLTPESFKKASKTKVPKGHISGVFYNDAEASAPVKISPLQFALLESNQDLKEGTGQKVAHSKESKSTGATLNLAKKDENIIPVPKSFIDDEYFEDKVKGNPTIKAGGYLDIKTGIYIQPADNSEYDAANDIYYPPLEFGGIDEESGEYVAPPGLILHPLKGFMFTTDVLQKGFHTITNTATNIVNPVKDLVTNVGTKSFDTVKNTATAIRDNTGIVGSTVGKGVELVGDGVSGTLNIAQDSSSYVLNNVANSLNSVIHDTFLTRITDLKGQIPIINYFKIKVNQGFEYRHVNTDKYNLYDRYVERHGAFNSQTNVDLKVQRSFYSNFFIRPHFEIKKKSYFGDDTNLYVFNQETYYTGADFGYSTLIKEMKYQTYFSIEKGKKRKALPFSEKFLTHEDSWRFSFNKLILGQKMFSTTFGYQFEKYESHFDGKGRRHLLKISEILTVDDSKFVRLSFDWNKIYQDLYGSTTNWSTKLNFFVSTLKWNMNFDYWVGARFIKDAGVIIKRHAEENYFLGTTLTKNFENNFSVQFNYEILKQRSPIQTYDYTAQSFITSMNYSF